MPLASRSWIWKNRSRRARRRPIADRLSDVRHKKWRLPRVGIARFTYGRHRWLRRQCFTDGSVLYVRHRSRRAPVERSSLDPMSGIAPAPFSSLQRLAARVCEPPAEEEVRSEVYVHLSRCPASMPASQGHPRDPLYRASPLVSEASLEATSAAAAYRRYRASTPRFCEEVLATLTCGVPARTHRRAGRSQRLLGD